MILPTERSIHDYEDIIDLPHHVSARHLPMSMMNRAAQFSPFAALTGYETMVDEAARLVDQRASLDDSQREVLDHRLQLLRDHLSEEPPVSLVYFAPDRYKQGGSYQTLTGVIKKLDEMEKAIVLTSGEVVPMADLYSISSPMLTDLL